MFAYKRGSQVRLLSRVGRDHTPRFPQLVAAVSKRTPDTLILDSEVCIFDQQLVSRFEWLREQPKDQPAMPPIFMAFDCLCLAGRDLRNQDLSMRRDELEQVLDRSRRALAGTAPGRRWPESVGMGRRARLRGPGRSMATPEPHPLRKSRQKPHMRFVQGLK